MVRLTKTNAYLKKIASLAHKKYRSEFGLFVVEGLRNVFDVVNARPQAVESVLSTDIAHLERLPSSIQGYLIDSAAANALSDTKNSQQVFAVVKSSALLPLADRVEYGLVLDRIRDPGNLGCILRSARATGFCDIILIDCVDLLSPKVVRSSMSAIVGLRFLFASTAEQALPCTKGARLVCADMDGEPAFGKQISAPLFLVIGNEANGISAELKNASSDTISLPMEGIESLNAGAAATTLMYILKYGLGER